MNHDEKYRAWKDRPIPVNVSPDFAGEVMRRVHRESQVRWNWPGVLELFQRNVSLRFAAVGIAAMAGLSRFWLIFSAILNP